MPLILTAIFFFSGNDDSFGNLAVHYLYFCTKTSPSEASLHQRTSSGHNTFYFWIVSRQRSVGSQVSSLRLASLLLTPNIASQVLVQAVL